MEPSAIVATTKVQPSEPEELEEWECLFHSQMSINRTLLHFIVDSGSQKNLILVEVVKKLDLPMLSPNIGSLPLNWGILD